MAGSFRVAQHCFTLLPSAALQAALGGSAGSASAGGHVEGPRLPGSRAAAARQQLLHSSDVAGQQQFGQRHLHVCKTCFQNSKHVKEFPFKIKHIVREREATG